MIDNQMLKIIEMVRKKASTQCGISKDMPFVTHDKKKFRKYLVRF